MANVLVPHFTALGIPASNTNYLFAAMGVLDGNAPIETQVAAIYRTAATFSMGTIRISAYNRGAGSWAFRINSSNGNQGVTGITGPGEYQDATNSDSVAVGQKANYAFTVGAGGTTVSINATAGLCNATGLYLERLCIVDQNTLTNNSATVNHEWGGPYFPTGGSGVARSVYYRVTGVLKNLYCLPATNTRTTTTKIQNSLNGSLGNCVVSFAAGVTTATEDTTDVDTVPVGLPVAASSVMGADSNNWKVYMVLQDFVGNGGVHIGGGNNTSTQAISLTNYYHVSMAFATQSNATESVVQQNALGAYKARNLQINVATNTVTATSTFKFRIGSANGNQNISISGSGTALFEDTTNTDTVGSSSLIDYQLVTGGTGTSLSPSSMSHLAQYATAGGVAGIL